MRPIRFEPTTIKNPKTLLIIQLSELIQLNPNSKPLQWTLNENFISQIKLVTDKVEQKVSHIKDLREILSLAFFLSEVDYDNNRISYGRGEAKFTSNLEPVLNLLKQTEPFNRLFINNGHLPGITAAVFNEDFILIPFKTNPNDEMVYDPELVKQACGGDFGNNIALIANDNSLIETHHQWHGNDSLAIKVYGPAEFDRQGLMELISKIDKLHKENNLNQYKKVIVYLDIDDTSLLWDISKQVNQTIINPDVVTLKNLLCKYFDENKIEFRILTARDAPIRTQLPIFQKRTRKFHSLKSIDFEIADQIIKFTNPSSEERFKSTAIWYKMQEEPTYSWRVIFKLESMLNCDINADDKYFTNGKMIKSSVIHEECKKSSEPVFMIYCEDNSKAIDIALKYAQNYESNFSKKKSSLFIIQAHQCGNIENQGADHLFDFITENAEQAITTAPINDSIPNIYGNMNILWWKKNPKPKLNENTNTNTEKSKNLTSIKLN